MNNNQEWEEELWIEVMEDYVITAELGHLAKDQKKHKDEMRENFARLIKFFSKVVSSEKEKLIKTILGEVEKKQFEIYTPALREEVVKLSDVRTLLQAHQEKNGK